jgi:hypothetical protein
MFFQIWIAVIAVIIMAGGLGGIFYLIIKQNAVIGTRTVQLISIVLVLPLMLALGVLNVIGRETIGPLVGVIIGYVLSGSWKE